MDDLNGMSQCALRPVLRERRKAITSSEREKLSEQAAQLAKAELRRLFTCFSGQRIGVFLALPEELDTKPLIQLLWAEAVSLYLPFVHARDSVLHWQRYHPDSKLVRDIFDIPAPQNKQQTRVEGMALDAVITPLVGWDRQGNRIGMGGGFYDRTFADKIAAKPPKLLGYAYACQEVQQGIKSQPWDIRLDGVVNEQESLNFTGV